MPKPSPDPTPAPYFTATTDRPTHVHGVNESEVAPRARVVHCRRDAFDAYIGRPGRWGNPFSSKAGTLALHRVQDRTEAIARHRAWFLAPEQAELRALARRELTGKRLGCWCKTPDQPQRSCHGDVLAAYVNGELGEEFSETGAPPVWRQGELFNE